MPEVMITGAQGFIGSRLVKEFLSHGWKVTALSSRAGSVHGLNVRVVNFAYGGGVLRNTDWH